MKRFIQDCVQAAAAAIHFGVDVLVPMETPYDPEQPASDREVLDRLVFLVEDIRNILSSAAPMPCGVAAERPPEDLGVPLAASGGHSITTRAWDCITEGLQAWMDGEPCDSPRYYRALIDNHTK